MAHSSQPKGERNGGFARAAIGKSRKPMNRRSILRKTMRVLGFLFAGVGCVAVAACAWYLVQFYPRQIEPYEINTADISPRILIATHGSEFKNELVSELGSRLESEPAYVKVINVGDLDEVEIADWQKIVVVNTVMMNKLGSDVRDFIARAEGRDDLLLMFTSGGADFKPTDLGVDAVSGASRMVDTSRLAGLVTDWIEKDGAYAQNPGDPVLAMEYFLDVDVEGACAGLKADPEIHQARYADLEGRLNRIGYGLVMRDKQPSALEVFRVNKDLFPESWNVFDSYAEALLANGDRDGAIANYRRSLELNPDSESGKRALAALESGPD
jgi:tetratricopeptide (TPR) repeat protein